MIQPGTPLPWHLGNNFIGVAVHGRTGLHRIASTDDTIAGVFDMDTANANAAYIVRAANLFPELVAALRRHLDDCYFVKPCLEVNREEICEPCQARVLLQKCEE